MNHYAYVYTKSRPLPPVYSINTFIIGHLNIMDQPNEVSELAKSCKDKRYFLNEFMLDCISFVIIVDHSNDYLYVYSCV